MPAGSVNILLLGSGGREHALAWSLAKSNCVAQVICIPGNGGTAEGDPKIKNVEHGIARTDFEWLVAYAKSNEIGLVVSGSEEPIVNGVEMYFKKAGIPFFGPSYEAARLEGSKCFAKDFMTRHHIPTAAYSNFDDFEAAKEYLERMQNLVVIKASGLAAGKGVLMPVTKEESIEDLKTIMVDRAFGESGSQVVIEEKLEGDEISITMLSDGKSLKTFPAGQDAQRILDGNLGANTGGMGVYAPTDLLSNEQLREIESKILQPTIDGCRKEGFPFIGFICIGLIMSSSGPKLLEYNVRFGDPEAQTLLPMLDENSDLAQILFACVAGKLHEIHMGFLLGHSVSVVAAAEGYPFKYQRGDEIVLSPKPEGTLIFHAGTIWREGKLRSNGGRVLACVFLADSLQGAVDGAYEAMGSVSFRGKYFRKDIGQRYKKIFPT